MSDNKRKAKKHLIKFEECALEVDHSQSWRAEAELKHRKFKFKQQGDTFYFENDADANRAFELFNRLNFILY